MSRGQGGVSILLFYLRMQGGFGGWLGGVVGGFV